MPNPVHLTARALNEACTYAAPPEIDALHGYGAVLPPEAVIVMLGAGPGVLLFALLEAHPVRPKATVIDHDTCQWVKAHLYDAGLDTGVSFWIIDSAEAGKQWREPVDFLIVDADHSTEGVTRDILAWGPHMKAGGRVWFHDYDYTGTQWEGNQVSGVKAAVDALLLPDEWEKLEQVGCSVVFEKQ